MSAAREPSLPHVLPSQSPPLLVNWLSSCAAYPERTASVERIETHISCVFLTDHFAYKLKKPVCFDFLDFSTLELRRQACEDEIRLNRRLAPHVYLGLVAVRRHPSGEFYLDENAPVASSDAFEWLIKMRRLPDAATLLSKIRTNSITDSDADAIAARLAEFYRKASSLSVAAGTYRAEIERHVRGNWAELRKPQHAFDANLLRRIHSAQLRQLFFHPQIFDARIAAGRIVDGHGDLRPEHIYLLAAGPPSEAQPPQPAIIDCIEFNAEFRHLDVADELSFLATECDYRGAASLGNRIFECTSAQLGDQPPPELTAFYRSYRACVRAKVAALRAKQQTGDDQAKSTDEAQRHLQWAQRYARQLPPPFVIVICGLMGSGKSTLAAKLGELLGADLLATDRVRQEIYGKSQEPHGYATGHYRPEDRQRVYDEMFARASAALQHDLAVILDGAFPYAHLRAAAMTMAGPRPKLVIHCRCPAEVAIQRITARLAIGQDPSEARPELYQRQRAEAEPDPAGLESIEIDTTAPLDQQLEFVVNKLRSLSNS